MIGPIDGPATCLAVSGNVAVFNLQTPQFGVVTFEITDNAGSGQPDTIEGRATGQNEGRSPTDCTPLSNGLSEIVVEGDVVVVDAPPLPTSKEQCKNGGWQSFGVFNNQGDCVNFVATGGRTRRAAGGVVGWPTLLDSDSGRGIGHAVHRALDSAERSAACASARCPSRSHRGDGPHGAMRQRSDAEQDSWSERADRSATFAIVVDATSGPSGESPTGQLVTFISSMEPCSSAGRRRASRSTATLRS